MELALVRSTILMIVLVDLFGSDKAALSKAPLTADETEILSLFLDSYLEKGSGPPTNLSDRTVPLILSGPFKEDSCLEGLKLSGWAEAEKTIHLLGADFGKNKPIRQVNPSKHKIKDPGKSIDRGESVENPVREGFDAGL